MTRWDENILHSCDDLRKLIVENPDLPLLVFAGESAYTDCGYTYTCTMDTYARIGEVLLDKGPCERAFKEDMIYCDRDTAEEDLVENQIPVSSKCCDISKKRPIKKYKKQQGCDLDITGERRAEGGLGDSGENKEAYCETNER